MPKFLVPFQITGLLRIEASDPEDAKDRFDLQAEVGPSDKVFDLAFEMGDAREVVNYELQPVNVLNKQKAGPA